jgi:hypothetical protein
MKKIIKQHLSTKTLDQTQLSRATGGGYYSLVSYSSIVGPNSLVSPDSLVLSGGFERIW